jgi:hypothetical protein
MIPPIGAGHEAATGWVFAGRLSMSRAVLAHSRLIAATVLAGSKSLEGARLVPRHKPCEHRLKT